jgi:hypothetical protein
MIKACSGKKRRKTSGHSSSSFQSALLHTKLATNVLAPFCSTSDLAALLATCRGFVIVLPELTKRGEWSLSTVENWSPKRLKYVRSLLVDTFSVRQLPCFLGLENLDLGNFNEPIVLPAGLKKVKFGYTFNQPVGVLPATLTHLEFGYCFNQTVDYSLPATLTHLHFGGNFNQIVRVLPSSLEHLTFGPNFNQPLAPGMLPANLKYLRFGFDFDQPIVESVLPMKLEHLVFGYAFSHPLEEHVLPAGLQTLEFGYVFNVPLQAGVLPRGLKHLTFGLWFNQPLVFLPPDLEVLTFGRSFNQPVTTGMLPNSLKKLTFGQDFDQPITANVLPNLRVLRFGTWFDKPLKYLPFGLQDLKLGRWYSKKCVVPATLQNLKFYSGADIQNIPSSCRVVVKA